MTQSKFIELSKIEVRQLNGEHENEDVTTAWRAGYLYAQSLIRKSFEKDDSMEFLDKVETFIEPILDEFEW